MDFWKCNLTSIKNWNETYYDFASDNLSDIEMDFQIDPNIPSHNTFGGWVVVFS